MHFYRVVQLSWNKCTVYGIWEQPLVITACSNDTAQHLIQCSDENHKDKSDHIRGWYATPDWKRMITFDILRLSPAAGRQRGRWSSWCLSARPCARTARGWSCWGAGTRWRPCPRSSPAPSSHWHSLCRRQGAGAQPGCRHRPRNPCCCCEAGWRG